MYRQKILQLVFFLLVASVSFGQEVPKIIQFKNIENLSAHQNWMITQDCEGYLYVANTNGVLIYNGFKWQQVALPKRQQPRAVYLGKDCKVYTGTYETFGYIDFSDRDLPIYHALADSLLEDSNQEVWNIFGDDHQIVFQSFSNIYLYDYQNTRSILPPSNIMLGKQIDRQLYIPKIERGLYKISGDQVVEVTMRPQLPPKAKLADLCGTDQPGKIALGSQYHGVFILAGDQLQEVKSELNELFKKEQINKLIRLSSGTYAVGTILNGVYLTDDFINIKYHLNKSNGLSNNTVLSLFEDKNQDLWVGLDKGINLLKTSDPLTYLYDRQGKLGTIFTTIHHQNTLYLGTNQGVFRSNPDGSFSLINDSQGQIWSFMVIDGDLICGHNKGTYLIQGDQFIQISDITGGWCMEALGPQRILQSTYTGLVILEKKEGKWDTVYRVIDGNILIEKFALYQNTLVGYHSYYGVSVLQLSDHFDQVLEQKIIAQIDHHEINTSVDLLTSVQGVVIPLDSNLYLLEKDSFVLLQANAISELQKEAHFSFQYKFYQAIQEVSKFENISNYYFSKPLISTDTFIIGFDEGYLSIPQSYQLRINLSEHIAIDFVRVNGKIFPETNDLTFRASENNLSIQIKDFSFDCQNIPLQFKLDPWSDQWQDIPADGQLNFINLDDGDYDLYLADHRQSPTQLLHFTIQPHWYESWIGALLYATLLFFLIWYLNESNHKKLKLQTERLQKEKEREVESERIKAKNDKLEREIIYKSKMLANSTMALVQKNNMLNQLKSVIIKDDLASDNNRQYKQRVLNLIDRNINNDEDWEIFEQNFAEVHEDFLDKLKQNFPDITAGELKLAAYIRMNLSSKEIAPLLNISVRSVENKRYRLRKKMGIEHENNLSDYLLRL